MHTCTPGHYRICFNGSRGGLAVSPGIVQHRPIRTLCALVPTRALYQYRALHTESVPHTLGQYRTPRRPLRTTYARAVPHITYARAVMAGA
eukprot:3935276-Rhodomonas_salina.2